jgi:hypothetical protein
LGSSLGSACVSFQLCVSCASWIMSCCTAPALAGGGSEQEQEEEGEDEGWPYARHANGEFVSVPLIFSFFERGAGIGGAAGIWRQVRACIGTGVGRACVVCVSSVRWRRARVCSCSWVTRWGCGRVCSCAVPPNAHRAFRLHVLVYSPSPPRPCILRLRYGTLVC